jgi:hypothetical protein
VGQPQPPGGGAPAGLRQVLTHSANHRADVNQWLPRFGVDSASVDYIALALTESET